jgi:hypothetical protein
MGAAPTTGNVLIGTMTIRSNSTGTTRTGSAIYQSGVYWARQSAGVQIWAAAYDGSTEVWVGIATGASPSATGNIKLGGTKTLNEFVFDICEYSGIVTGSYSVLIDQSGSYTDATVMAKSGSTGTTATTTSGSELWVGSVGCYGGYSATGSGTILHGFTLLDGVVNNATANAYVECITGATGTAFSWVSGAGANSLHWVGAIATLYGTGAPAVTYTTSSNDSNFKILPRLLVYSDKSVKTLPRLVNYVHQTITCNANFPKYTGSQDNTLKVSPLFKSSNDISLKILPRVILQSDKSLKTLPKLLEYTDASFKVQAGITPPTSVTIGSGSSNSATSYPSQRKSFYAQSLLWHFFSDGTNMVYSTSSAGVTWGTSSAIRACSSGRKFDIHFDGTYVHYAYAPETAGGDLMYARGTPTSTGSIDWSAEQTVYNCTNNPGIFVEYVYYPSVAVDTGSYPYISYGYQESIGATISTYLTKSSANDGTWTTAATFPFTLTSINYDASEIVPLTNGKMYVVYGKSSETIKGRLFSGSTVNNEETGSMGVLKTSGYFSATAINDDMHLVFLLNSPNNIEYDTRTYSNGYWSTGSEFVVQTVENTPTRIQYARGVSTGSTNTTVLSSNPQNGNLLIATVGIIGSGASTANVTSITQSGVTWTPQKSGSYPSEYMRSEIWAGVAGAAGTSNVVVNFSAANSGSVVNVCEYNGLLTAGFLDQTAITSGSDISTSTGVTPTIGQPSELFVGTTTIYRDNSQVTGSVAKGFTLLDGLSYNSMMSSAYLEKINLGYASGSSGTYLATGSIKYIGCIATFKASYTTAATMAPCISAVTGSGDLFVFWAGYPLANHIYYRRYNNTGSWETVVDWQDETSQVLTANDRLTVMPKFYNDIYTDLEYSTKTSSPYNVKVAILTYPLSSYLIGYLTSLSNSINWTGSTATKYIAMVLNQRTKATFTNDLAAITEWQEILRWYARAKKLGIVNQTVIQSALDNSVMVNGLPTSSYIQDTGSYFSNYDGELLYGYYWSNLYNYQTSKWNLTTAFNNYYSTFTSSQNNNNGFLYYYTPTSSYSEPSRRFYDEQGQTLRNFLLFYDFGMNSGLTYSQQIWDVLNNYYWNTSSYLSTTLHYYGYISGSIYAETEAGGFLETIAYLRTKNYSMTNYDRLAEDIESRFLRNLWQSLQWTYITTQKYSCVHEHYSNPQFRLTNTLMGWGAIMGAYDTLTATGQSNVQTLLAGTGPSGDPPAWSHLIKDSTLYNSSTNLFRAYSDTSTYDNDSTAQGCALLFIMGLVPITARLAVTVEELSYEYPYHILDPDLYNINIPNRTVQLALLKTGSINFLYGPNSGSWNFSENGVWQIGFNNLWIPTGAGRLSSLPANRTYLSEPITLSFDGSLIRIIPTFPRFADNVYVKALPRISSNKDEILKFSPRFQNYGLDEYYRLLVLYRSQLDNILKMLPRFPTNTDTFMKTLPRLSFQKDENLKILPRFMVYGDKQIKINPRFLSFQEEFLKTFPRFMQHAEELYKVLLRFQSFKEEIIKVNPAFMQKVDQVLKVLARMMQYSDTNIRLTPRFVSYAEKCLILLPRLQVQLDKIIRVKPQFKSYSDEIFKIIPKFTSHADAIIKILPRLLAHFDKNVKVTPRFLNMTDKYIKFYPKFTAFNDKNLQALPRFLVYADSLYKILLRFQSFREKIIKVNPKFMQQTDELFKFLPRMMQYSDTHLKLTPKFVSYGERLYKLIVGYNVSNFDSIIKVLPQLKFHKDELIKIMPLFLSRLDSVFKITPKFIAYNDSLYKILSRFQAHRDEIIKINPRLMEHIDKVFKVLIMQRIYLDRHLKITPKFMLYQDTLIKLIVGFNMSNFDKIIKVLPKLKLDVDNLFNVKAQFMSFKENTFKTTPKFVNYKEEFLKFMPRMLSHSDKIYKILIRLQSYKDEIIRINPRFLTQIDELLRLLPRMTSFNDKNIKLTPKLMSYGDKLFTILASVPGAVIITQYDEIFKALPRFKSAMDEFIRVKPTFLLFIDAVFKTIPRLWTQQEEVLKVLPRLERYQDEIIKTSPRYAARYDQLLRMFVGAAYYRDSIIEVLPRLLNNTDEYFDVVPRFTRYTDQVFSVLSRFIDFSEKNIKTTPAFTSIKDYLIKVYPYMQLLSFGDYVYSVNAKGQVIIRRTWLGRSSAENVWLQPGISDTKWTQKEGDSSGFLKPTSPDSPWLSKEDGQPDFNEEGEESYIDE